MNKVTIFKYEENKLVRTMDISGEPWFVLKDVCDVLGLSTPARVAERLDSDEVSQAHLIDSVGRSQEMTIISESGLYNVILRSDKPEAKPFRKWVTAVVLPSIRKNGGYIAGQEELSPQELMAKASPAEGKAGAGRNDCGSPSKAVSGAGSGRWRVAHRKTGQYHLGMRFTEEGNQQGKVRNLYGLRKRSLFCCHRKGRML